MKKVIALKDLDCANCAMKMEQGIKKIHTKPGTSEDKTNTNPAASEKKSETKPASGSTVKKTIKTKSLKVKKTKVTLKKGKKYKIEAKKRG